MVNVPSEMTMAIRYFRFEVVVVMATYYRSRFMLTFAATSGYNERMIRKDS